LLLKNNKINRAIHPASSGCNVIMKYGDLMVEKYRNRNGDLIADLYVPESYLPSNMFVSQIVPPYV
jgi:hypothetical protein